MGDIKLFSIADGNCIEYKGKSMTIEKSLQTLMEKHLEELLGIKFLATEFVTGRKHNGRIDTLGLDENNSPVIIEYKRSTNENVINQGLYYIDWLLDHKGDFYHIVLQQLGRKVAEEIEWTAPRLLCIAGGFTRYDEYAVEQIDRNIELYRYSYFDEGLLMLDLVNATTSNSSPAQTTSQGRTTEKTFIEKKAQMQPHLVDVFNVLNNFILSIGDDVQFKELKFYGAYKRIKNFACIETYPSKDYITLYVKANIEDIQIDNDFMRDVTGIGHYGTGNLQINIRDENDIEKAKPYIMYSYENN
ncbi:DUF5655 domain-containing protein [Macrococcoides caseolyticum]|uniref:DUF5655 domain-containing protein n=1 Tax=Macrococcoides caseolyticum TaxID=69966 RepID=UPI000DFFD03B|nr:DUF5655 domain-containing protein [Macrococcus caseolyticus]STY78245.1 Uncharacterized conserved protein [Macrococcus caseolyticus]